MARTITRSTQQPRKTAPARRNRLTRRLLPILGVAVVALVVGLVIGSAHVPPEQKLADRFARAWDRSDFRSMYGLLSSDAQRRTSPAQFAAAYRRAEGTATQLSLRAAKAPEPNDGVVALPVRVRTRVWGVVAGTVALPFAGDGDSARIDWKRNLVFPGLAEGRSLSRRTQLGARGEILARDGTKLANGADGSPAFPAATGLVGEMGPQGRLLRARLRPLGFPATAQVGISGLQLALNEELAGKPGGVLRAGARLLARSPASPGADVRTTIDAGLQKTSVATLAGRLGGVAALRPDGQVLAMAGIAATDLAPPGSTFKMVTLTAALEAGITKPSAVYPVQSATQLSGVRLENANGEDCGGTLVQSFANSCNSVFAPLGAKLGGPKLVSTAERYGFNHPVGIPGYTESTIPPGNKIGDDLAVGSSAIGQGDVQATALQMAVVAATVANRGRRPQLHLVLGTRPHYTRATSTRVARIVSRLMVAVVRFGTGTAAAISGVVVAGKTGTAELGNTVDQSGQKNPNAPDTDAWFAAFAPVRRPRIAVGVLLVEAGAGADVGAPAAHDVLAAALQR